MALYKCILIDWLIVCAALGLGLQLPWWRFVFSAWSCIIYIVLFYKTTLLYFAFLKISLFILFLCVFVWVSAWLISTICIRIVTIGDLMSSVAFLVACHMCTYINKIIIYCMQLFMLANKIWLMIDDSSSRKKFLCDLILTKTIIIRFLVAMAYGPKFRYFILNYGRAWKLAN